MYKRTRHDRVKASILIWAAQSTSPTRMIALQCTNVLGTIVLERVINLGGTNQHHWHDHPRHTIMQKFI
jgi:hypothetical protein